MGKVEIGIYFCVTSDILTNVLLKCPLPIIWILSKSLILIGGHGNRKATFSKKKNQKSSSQKPYNLHSCIFRWALWPMGLWFESLIITCLKCWRLKCDTCAYPVCENWTTKIPIENLSELRHDNTNKTCVRPAKTQISLGIRPVWRVSSLCAQ